MTHAEENMQEVLRKRKMSLENLQPMDISKPLAQKPEEKFREEVKDQLDRIEIGIKSLNNRLDLIFGTNVIVDGRFVPIQNKNRIDYSSIAEQNTEVIINSGGTLE